MHFGFILNIILFKYLQSSEYTKTNYPELEKYYKHGINLSIGLLVIYFAAHPVKEVTVWISNIINLGMAYLAYHRKELQPIKLYVNAFLPLLVVSVINNLSELIGGSFHNFVEPLIDTASFFAVIWLVALWIIIRRQQKALEKERINAEEKEKQIELAGEMKLLLEQQVAERTLELTTQKEELLHTLENLRSTQNQLVHAEKMASLGELTAGIAHEIQNPLNFVNNFSEVSNEMLGELEDEIQLGNLEEVKAIAKDLKQNLEKITHHGKRADSIVKGMLMHSRSSEGTKTPADINALADEYLRLAYHGLRAKDVTFNATFSMDLDPRIGMVEMIPQDIGRVLLNLITNAFQACNELSKKAKETDGNETGDVKVITKDKGDKIELKVIDNALGIPEAIQDKIFQPFFTTKPTGQGTGLGLSLAHDIIRAHGGTIEVFSELGVGTEFKIILPKNSKNSAA